MKAGGEQANDERSLLDIDLVTPSHGPSLAKSSQTPQGSPSEILSLGSPSTSVSGISPSSETPSSSFVWRSPRQRTLTNRFTSDDFRANLPGGQGKIPRGAIRGASREIPQGGSENVECGDEEWQIKQSELDSLRKTQLENLRYVN